MRAQTRPRPPYWLSVMRGHTPSAPNCRWHQPGDFTDSKSVCASCLHNAPRLTVTGKGTSA